MDVTRNRALRGPNRWSRRTVLEAVVVCAASECALDTLPGFEARVRALFPAIGALRHGGAGPVSLAQVLEVAALGLQAAAGCPVAFSHSAATGEAGTWQVVVGKADVSALPASFAVKVVLRVTATLPPDTRKPYSAGPSWLTRLWGPRLSIPSAL